MDKTKEIKDYLEIIVRRKWFFIIPLVVIIMIAGGYAKWAPKIYRASTLILVEQPELPTDYYVRPTVTERREDRLLTVEQQIKSNVFIEKIVEEFNLFAEQKKKPTWESVLEHFRKHIDVNVTGEQAFSISFEDRDPMMAMKVANRLTTLFIERSLQLRLERALGTISFLDNELKRVRIQLKQQEKQLSDFRARHLGVLPEDLTPLGRETIPVDISETDDVVVLYSLLRRLQLKYTDEHPEIIRIKARIAEVENKRKKMGGTTALEAQSGPADVEKPQLTARNRFAIEQQLKELTRRYEVTQTEYQSLLDKRLQAELAASLEEKQKAQRFQILDQARIPEQPYKPKSQNILLIGLLLAMATGVGLVYVTESLDTSFYKIKDLEEFTKLPVIANISKMKEKKTSISKISKTFNKIFEKPTEMTKKKKRRN